MSAPDDEYGAVIYPVRGWAWFFAPTKKEPHVFAGLAGDAIAFDLGVAREIGFDVAGLQFMTDAARARLLTSFGQILDDTYVAWAEAIVDARSIQNSPVLYFGLDKKANVVRTGTMMPVSRDPYLEHLAEKDEEAREQRRWESRPVLFGRQRT